MEKLVAFLTVRHADTMRPKERLAVVKWLRRQAEVIRLEPDKLARRYTARYWGVPP